MRATSAGDMCAPPICPGLSRFNRPAGTAQTRAQLRFVPLVPLVPVKKYKRYTRARVCVPTPGQPGQPGHAYSLLGFSVPVAISRRDKPGQMAEICHLCAPHHVRQGDAQGFVFVSGREPDFNTTPRTWDAS